MLDPNSSIFSLDDKQIVKLVIAGQKDKFEVLVDRYNRKLFAYLCRLLNFNQNDAQDVLQETLLKAYVNLVAFNSRLSFNAWIYRIAHNIAIDLIRKKYKYYIVDTNDKITQNKIHTNQTIVTKNHNDLELPINKDRLDSILSKLDISNRNLLVMFYLQGLSLKEISDIFKTSSNTISVRLKRARQKAQKIILDLKL